MIPASSVTRIRQSTAPNTMLYSPWHCILDQTHQFHMLNFLATRSSPSSITSVIWVDCLMVYLVSIFAFIPQWLKKKPMVWPMSHRNNYFSCIEESKQKIRKQLAGSRLSQGTSCLNFIVTLFAPNKKQLVRFRPRFKLHNQISRFDSLHSPNPHMGTPEPRLLCVLKDQFKLLFNKHRQISQLPDQFFSELIFSHWLVHF